MKVSVVIPVYNCERTIAAAVESALAQRFGGEFEVIVVNDGSTDGTRAALEKFGPLIRVIDQENAGVAAARNAGIRAAAGEYIALLDADDTWTEDKLAKTVAVLDQNPACVSVFSDAVQVDGAGNVIVPYFVPPHQAHSPTLDETLAECWMIQPSATVTRRATLIATGGFPEVFGPRGYGGEDTYAFLLVRERGEIHFVPDKLVRYRLSEFNENFAKRVRSGDKSPQQMFGGYLIFARLVRDRYGARGRALVRLATDTVGSGLVSLGLMAIHEGDRALAIQYYRESIRYRPLDLKTYVRMSWAMLPVGIADRFIGFLTPRMRRSLSGPPFHVLFNRPN
jgi:glycosyltransferase involved in cell wall biosynthesis